jgi:hypothetical protein
MKSNIFILTCVMVLGLSLTAHAETNTVTSTVTGTTTVDKTPPTASAPNVMINNQDVCSTGTSAAVQTQVFGIAGGTTFPLRHGHEGCRCQFIVSRCKSI